MDTPCERTAASALLKRRSAAKRAVRDFVMRKAERLIGEKM